MVDAEYIAKIVKKTANARGYDGEIANENNLLDIGIDSLDIMEIVMTVEKRFNIRVDDNRIGGIKTINEIVKLFETVE